MKLTRLLALVGTILLSCSAWAQTDVTSTYLTNADFEGEYSVFANLNSGSNARAIYQPEGWTPVRKGTDSNDLTCLTSSDLQSNSFSAYTMAHSGSKTYWTRLRWSTNTGLTLKQIIPSLVAGTYTLSAEMNFYDSNSSNSAVLYAGTVTKNATRRTTKSNSGWETVSLSFTYTSTTENVEIGFKLNHVAESELIAGVDNFQLTYKNIRGEVLSKLIAQATGINSKLGTLTSEIATAQSVYDGINDTPAYQATIDDAITTLQTAINTKVLAYSYNAAGDDVTWLVFRPGFEGMTAESANYATVKGKDYSSEGWTMVETGDWGYGAIMAYGSGKTFNSAAVPATDNAGNTGNTLGISVGWGWTQRYQSEVITLPAGSYRLSVKAYNANSDAQQFTSKFGFVPTDGDPSLSTKTSFASNTWETDEVDFVLASATEGRFQIGGTAVSGGSGSNAKVFFDNISLTYFDPLKLAQIQWQEVWDALDALDETALPDAAETAITDALAETEPTTVDGYNTAKAALQALIDSYDEIKAAFDEYKALKAQVVDLKNTDKYTFTGAEALSTFNSTLSTIDGDAEDATDAATITALLPDLKEAGNTFVGGIESNDGFDLTYNVVNNSFETGALTPWTTNGSNDTGVKPNSNGTYTTTGVDGSYLFNTWNNGTGSKVSQTLSDLPNGYYTVTALVASDAGNTINILAGATTKTVNADGTNGKNQFVEGTTDKTLVSDGSLEIGTNSATWYKSDYFRLTYYTETAGAAEAWAAAKAAAEAARDNAEYANVSGSEKTTLLAEISKEEPATAEAYGTATTALQEATSAFKAAKDSYDGLVAKRTEASSYTTVAWPYASTAKKTALDDAVAAVPTNAEDAVTKTNAITTAIRQFVESNGIAEGVDVAVSYASAIAGADPDVNTGWTGGIGVDNRDGEKYTDGSGATSGKYYDGGWSTSAGANITMTRTLTLPAGEYLLQVTARGSENLTTYTMSVGEVSVDLPKQGSGVNTGTFGHGWSDKYIVFTSEGTDLTLTFAATSTEYQQWISFNRLRLTKLDATLATAEDYEDLEKAIAIIEGKLGFEDDEYAPYNNVSALAKLAEAKAIDKNVNNVQDDVQALTTYLNTAANWTANDGDVDAIYNGMFNSNVEGDWGLTGWTRTNSWGAQQTGLSGDYETAYYNQPGSLKYGNTGFYTMPLKGNTIYKLTVSYRSHENNSNKSLTVSVLNAEDGLAATAFAGNGSTSEWKTITQRFRTGAAGNYVLTLANSGNTWMTNVSLVKENEAADITIAETATSKPQADPLANVKLTRTLSADYWNTFSVPFDAAIPEGWDVKEYDSENSADNVISFKDATSFVAGVPYLVKPATDVVNPIFNDVKVQATEGTTKGEGNYKFAAQIYNKSLATDGTIAYLATDGSVKALSSATGLKGLRAYFIVPAPAAGVKALVINLGDEETGINSIDNGQLTIDNAKIYNLAGQRVSKAQKGLYIVNGKKVIIK